MSLQFFRGRAAQGGSYTGLRDAPGQASVVSFGATGDGTTDDSAAITAAIEAVKTAGGGTVYFPPGTYRAQGLPIYENIYYRGAGPVATTIMLVNAASTDLFIATKSGDFTTGGFFDMALNGVSAAGGKDGITFSGVTGALNRYYLNRVQFQNFRYGYAGPTTGGSNPLGGSQQNEFETYVENCSFYSCTAGMRTYENPFVMNCRFNSSGVAGSAGTGITGRLSDAYLIGNSFSQLDWSVKPETGNANINSIFQGNLFYGMTTHTGGYHLAIDTGCVVTGNIFVGLGSGATSIAAETGLLIRGGNCTVTSNKFGRQSGSLKGGFSVAAIDFSPTDYTGADVNPAGMACLIAENHFINDEGPAIRFVDGTISTAAKTFEGCNIRGNTFHITSSSGFRAIDLRNTQNGGNFPFTRGNTICGNNFVINKNSYNLPALHIAYSFYGNHICDNNFYFGAGFTTNTPIMAVDASGSLITGNRIHGAPAGGTPGFSYTSKNALSRIYGNMANANSSEQVAPEMGFNETRVLGKLIGANFNVTTDQAIAINSTRYIVERVMVCAPSISLTTAAGGFYTAASKGGTAIVAAAQAYSALTGATKWLDCTLTAGPASDIYTGSTLYLSLTTAQGAAATADVYIIGRDIGKS